MGPDAVPIVDDTALLKQGRCSVGLAHQYPGRLGDPGSPRISSIAILAGERSGLLDRRVDRNEHLDQLERVLGNV